jgi:hypothetical protein
MTFTIDDVKINKIWPFSTMGIGEVVSYQVLPDMFAIKARRAALSYSNNNTKGKKFSTSTVEKGSSKYIVIGRIK